MRQGIDSDQQSISLGANGFFKYSFFGKEGYYEIMSSREFYETIYLIPGEQIRLTIKVTGWGGSSLEVGWEFT